MSGGIFYIQMSIVPRVSLILPKTKDGRIILCKRAKDKEPYPGTWVCAIGGKANPNETFEQAAQREMREEAKLEAELIKKGTFYFQQGSYEADFCIYTTTKPLSIENLTPDPREIQYFQEFHAYEIQSMIDRNKNDFAPTFLEAFRVFMNSE